MKCSPPVPFLQLLLGVTVSKAGGKLLRLLRGAAVVARDHECASSRDEANASQVFLSSSRSLLRLIFIIFGMRLINVHTGKVEERLDDPEYAILSHTWEQGSEITYQDYVNGTNRHLPGYRKIEKCRALARKDGVDWVWCDTCCINKESSSELSEAINSMFAWYEQSVVCYVFLNDVSLPKSRAGRVRKSDLEDCRWFKRGWTLQELLAPTTAVFYVEKTMTRLGTKEDLAGIIAQITGIDSKYLLFHERISSASIARRMSWAAHRSTTRSEDMAYCMLGLFDVNIPLLYGEGAKAFRRLQLEILSQSDDDSILAWDADKGSVYGTYGVLAPSPSFFGTCGDICVIKQAGHMHLSTVEKKGIYIHRSVISSPRLLGFVPNSSGHYGSLENCVELPLLCGRELPGRRLEHAVLTLRLDHGDRKYRRDPWVPLGFKRFDALHDRIATELYLFCFGPERFLLDPGFGTSVQVNTRSLLGGWTMKRGVRWEMLTTLAWHVWVHILIWHWYLEEPSSWEFLLTCWMLWKLAPFNVFVIYAATLFSGVLLPVAGNTTIFAKFVLLVLRPDLSMWWTFSAGLAGYLANLGLVSNWVSISALVICSAWFMKEFTFYGL